MARHTDFYKTTFYPQQHNFLMSTKHLFEEALKFTYNKDGKTITKIVPVTYLGPYLKHKSLFKWDDELLKYDWKGCVYAIPEEVIFKY